MSKAMKGLLKGLRYISEIFEADNEKEPEIQIGAPTDVKHVAHIGCDGPSSNAPTWMNEFQGSDAGSSDNGGSKDSTGTSNRHGKSKQSKKQTSSKTSNSDNKTSRARRTKTSTVGSGSPSQESGAKKNRRKNRTSNRDPSASNADD